MAVVEKRSVGQHHVVELVAHVHADIFVRLGFGVLAKTYRAVERLYNALIVFECLEKRQPGFNGRHQIGKELALLSSSFTCLRKLLVDNEISPISAVDALELFDIGFVPVHPIGHAPANQQQRDDGRSEAPVARAITCQLFPNSFDFFERLFAFCF